MVIGESHVKINNMDTHNSKNETEIQKSHSYQRHQRQRFWQIFLPVALALLLILLIAIMIVMRAVETEPGEIVSQWADASLIWLIMPMLLFAIVAALVLVGLIYAFARLLNIVPDYTFLAQQYVALASAKIQLYADKLVEPIIAVRSVLATVNAFFEAAFGRSK